MGNSKMHQQQKRPSNKCSFSLFWFLNKKLYFKFGQSRCQIIDLDELGAYINDVTQVGGG